MVADSEATTHITNTEKYMFNKIKDRSTIVVETGKETKATAQDNIIICHSITNKAIKLKDILLVPEFQQKYNEHTSIFEKQYQNPSVRK